MPDDHTTRGSRGREADRPTEMPAAGWKDVLWRSWQEISENNIFLIAGGVTYAIVLALFPGLAALVSIYGLFFNPDQVERQVGALSGMLPEQSRQMLTTELHQLASASGGALSIGVVGGVVLAFWSASRGMSGLISAIDIAYEQKETRGFFRFNLVAILLTVAALVGGIIAVALIAVLPAAAQLLGLGSGTKWLLFFVQWPLLIVLVMVGLAAMYRYAPDRDEARWQWVSPGAIAATVLWIAGSIAFTTYVANFGSYDRTYGSLGGAVILLTWLYLSAFCVLLGAVLNAQSERQTRRDTTEGRPERLGRRGAYVADTVGRSSDR